MAGGEFVAGGDGLGVLDGELGAAGDGLSVLGGKRGVARLQLLRLRHLRQKRALQRFWVVGKVVGVHALR